MDESDFFEDETRLGDWGDSKGEAWFAQLLFWRPSKLSDEQMQLHFREWDGSWSSRTQTAINRFKAAGLDLNENWALSPQFWSCPACGRQKQDIFRLSKRGILLAKLELHHDHIRDNVWPRASQLFGSDWQTRVPFGSGAVLDNIRNITSRFDRCLLCPECNAADGKVKSKFRAQIDSKFTFTSTEIGQFVRFAKTEDYEPDYSRALEIWQAQREGFFARVALLDDLLKRVADGDLSNQQGVTGGARMTMSAFNSSSLLLKAFHSDARDSERASFLNNFRNEFLQRSTRRDSAKLTFAAKSKTADVPPTDEEYAAYVDPVRPLVWKALREDWACAVCRRRKREILRRGKKKKNWTGSVRTHFEYIDEEDGEVITRRRQLFPNFENDVFISEVRSIEVCAECAEMITRIGQWDQSLSGAYMSVQDRHDCIIDASPHASHEIDYEEARTRIAANRPYESASTAFNTYRALVSTFAGRFEFWRKQGIAKSDIMNDLAEHIQVFHRIDDRDECLDLVDWVLAQASGLGTDV